MKKFTLLFLGILLSAHFVIAGGLVHNTNQSAAWSRMLSRGATTEIDGVYFNPAGLTKLGDGFHISLSSQSIFQTQTITAGYPYLNESDYTGTISAPVFPSVYLAYKTGKFVFSFGFLAIGGGGGATFDKGVPYMEIPIASLVPAFSGDPYHVTGYSVDMEFKGTSVYWGIQGGISYEINKNVSIFAGARYVIAKNTYTGYIKNIKVITPEGSKPADEFMNGVATDATNGAAQATAGSTIATGAGNSMVPIIDGGGGALTWDQAVALGVITDAQSAQLQGGLMQFGFSAEEVAAMDMAQAQGSYYGTASYLTDLSASLLVQAGQLRAGASLMGDQEGDITQTGSGITPIIGANFSFMQDKLNFGLKYEFETKMDLKNEVPEGKGFAIGFYDDGSVEYLYANDSTENADLPAMFSIGMDYQLTDPLKLSLTYHTYMDKNTGWAHPEDSPKEIDKNFWEFAIGLEYDINEKVLVSGGYLHAETGVNQHYQSNLGFSLTSNTFALGGAYKFNDVFKLNIGAYYVMYDKANYTQYEGSGNNTIAYEETYLKSTFTAAIGVDISLGGKK
ncbi:MAG: outer membrane protein transport protein [Bacteroidota bacterium]